MRPGVVDLTCQREARAAQAMCTLKTRAQSCGLGRALHGLYVAPGRKMSDRHGAEPERHHRIERTEPDRLFGMLDRLAIQPREREAAAEMRVRHGGIRIEIDRPAK